MSSTANNVASHGDEWMNGSQAARLLGVDVSTLSRMRTSNRGPAYHQEEGCRPKYRRADVLAYIENTRRAGE